ncbi:MAG: U3 snoRNP protein [Paramarteilia canceri]
MSKEVLRKNTLSNDQRHTEVFKSSISPDGSIICYVLKNGYLNFYCTKSLDLVFKAKTQSKVSDIAFGQQSGLMLTSSLQNDEISVWDLKAQKSLASMNDNTLFSNSCLAISPRERLLAVGSKSGIVNLYSFEDSIESINDNRDLNCSKSLKNLTNMSTLCCFSPKTNLFLFASHFGDNSIKLMNCSTKTVYSNFLAHETGRLTAAAFSSHGKTMCLGLKSGAIKMYSLDV